MRSKNNETILIIDGGGRGAALAYKYSKSPRVSKILVAPGNDLIKLSVKKVAAIFPDVKTTDIKSIIKICKDNKVDLVDVAQDDAVAAGVSDALREEGYKVFGPSKEAGQIEWDKSWSRNFMKKYNLPIPEFKVCTSESEGAGFIKGQKESNWYIKASGLAAGKGAIFASNNKEALDAIKQMSSFGKSGETYLIEECLVGEEFSAFALVSGNDFQIIDYAQDHKKLYKRDKGPNTGGMGCVAKPLIISREIETQVKEIFKKTVNGLVEENRPYTGVLYLGGMVVKGDKVKIIEFNARWGDPEAEVIVPFLKNDLYEMTTNIADNKFNKVKLLPDTSYRIAVAVTSLGYPDDYSKAKSKEIFGLDKLLKSPEVLIFGAGVKKSGDKLVASGGRLFYVVCSGKNVADARQIAYNSLSLISIDGNNGYYREDIGWRDLERYYDSSN